MAKRGRVEVMNVEYIQIMLDLSMWCIVIWQLKQINDDIAKLTLAVYQ